MEESDKPMRYVPKNKLRPRLIKSPHTTDDEEEGEEKEDLEKTNKSVVHMKSKRGFTDSLDPDAAQRVKRFMSVYIDDNDTPGKKKRQQQQQQQQYQDFEPSSGRMTSTGVVVDDINRRFNSGDPIHLMSMMPPASSTPTSEELAGSWGALVNRGEREAEFFDDPVVKFFLILDGFLDNNTIIKKTVENTQNMKLADVYTILAGSQAANKAGFGRTNIRTFQMGPGGNAGLGNVGPNRPLDNSVRVGDGSVDDPYTQGYRRNELNMRTRIIQNGLETPGLTPINRSGPFIPVIGSDISSPNIRGPLFQSTPGRIPNTPGRSVNFNVAQDRKQYMEPSGPRRQSTGGEGSEGEGLESVRPLDISLVDEGDEDIGERVQEEEVQRRNQGSRMSGQSTQGTDDANTRATQNRDEQLYLLSRDPNNAGAVSKYLSDARAINAYQWMNRPEITGNLPLSSAVLAAVKLAYRQLMTKFPRNYSGATLMDFITNETINTEFAHYVSVIKLFNTSTAMNKVVLEKTTPRLMEIKNALEKTVFTRTIWNSNRGQFEDVSNHSGYDRPSSFRNNFARLYQEQNELFY